MRFASVVVLLLGAAACDSDRARLRVDLRTDYVAGVEFVEAVAEFDGAPHGRMFGPSDRDTIDHRVADLDVARGVFPLEVRLVGRDGRTLAARDVSVTIDGPSMGTTVVISRECQDVLCRDGESCLGGRCVPPACVRGDEPTCPDPQCTDATVEEDCRRPSSDCVRLACEFGVCASRSAGCTSDEYCDPDIGCVIVPPPDGRDAGGSDVGVDGGSVETDAGTDAGPDAGPDSGPGLDGGACVPGVDVMCVDCTDLGAWPAEWVAEEDAMLARMNEARAMGGECDGMVFGSRPAFVVDPILQRIARCHSQDMAENNFFGHMGSDGRWGDERAEDAGYTGTTSENVTAGTSGGAMAASIWLLSSGHCENIRGEFVDIGVGLGRWDGADHTYYWTADFGR